MFNLINLAEEAEKQLEKLTDQFSVAMYTTGLDRFDYQPGCSCPVCELEGKISSIYGILELDARTADYETAVA